MKTILVTGAAGFIGYHLSLRLLQKGFSVVGIDNLNSYYDVKLKKDRYIFLKKESSRFSFFKINICNYEALRFLFDHYRFDVVINLAAQAGVRYSLENPQAYIDSNVTGFKNILECCVNYNVRQLFYASSSSVYGKNYEIPFRESHRVEQPNSLYAATKRMNELMATTYLNLYGLSSIGLRFFSVYGEWGRPDMALWLFTEAISRYEPIKLFNKGDMSRDWTYVSDVVDAIEILLKETECSNHTHEVYNIGSSNPVPLKTFVKLIEKELGKSAITEELPMQSGDVARTYADVDLMNRLYNWEPKTKLHEGVSRFVRWYLQYEKDKKGICNEDRDLQRRTG